MKEPYDPTKAPLGPLGSRSNRKAMIIRHNKKVLARRLKQGPLPKPTVDRQSDIEIEEARELLNAWDVEL